jgi:hypothetical protein
LDAIADAPARALLLLAIGRDPQVVRRLLAETAALDRSIETMPIGR